MRFRSLNAIIVSVVIVQNGLCQAFLVPLKDCWSCRDAGCQLQENSSIGMEEYEAARAKFESYLEDSSSEGSHSCTSTSYIKPLTANSKRIKEVELKLLSELAESDDVVDPLVNLWVGERADASQILRDMEEVGNCSPGLQKEEVQLRAMIERYGSYWVEPKSRLAVLLFTKGRYSEAIDWTWTVLEAKPWHFEAAQLMVVMLLREGHFVGALRVAKSYCLPQLNERTHHKRRKVWVQKKVRQAKEYLKQSAMVTISPIQEDSSVEELCSLEEDFCWQ
jgi:hypothetical protein